jgi:hypothetical protein
MVIDAIQNNTETIVIVSGDTDIEPAITWIARNKPEIKIVKYIPALPENERERRGGTITKGVHTEFLPVDRIEKHLLPETIIVEKNGMKIKKPETWKKV